MTVQNTGPADDRITDNPDYRDGYSHGYVDAVVQMGKRAAENARPSSSIEESRDRLVETALSGLITIGMITKEVADALISLWARCDHLTPVELDAIRAAVEFPKGDDRGLSERFLEERQQQARLAAELEREKAAEAGTMVPVEDGVR